MEDGTSRKVKLGRLVDKAAVTAWRAAGEVGAAPSVVGMRESRVANEAHRDALEMEIEFTRGEERVAWNVVSAATEELRVAEREAGDVEFAKVVLDAATRSAERATLDWQEVAGRLCM